MKFDPDEPPPTDRFTITTAVLTIIIGAVGVFPIGLLSLVASTGVFDLFRVSEMDPKHIALLVFCIGSLIAIIVYGLSKIRSPGSFFRGAMMVLVIINLGGCASMCNDLSGIH